MSGSKSHFFSSGKSSQNSRILLLIFWVVPVCHVYFVSIYTLFKVVSHYGSCAVLVSNELPKKIGWGGGVGGVSSIHSFLEFV